MTCKLDFKDIDSLGTEQRQNMQVTQLANYQNSFTMSHSLQCHECYTLPQDSRPKGPGTTNMTYFYKKEYADLSNMPQR
jgi:hypothetical protein